ncbi:MAG: type IV secretory system conjugative DNA transfer family protein [gamma proteobacterium endosymbiont of Lamellibrachia anaximandri]|nr:type IV secretory system conjugative DNA transfer family protein [gamma proteobacterium endosymbiont of Lamellibrachia anaximandri]MBL3619462.1 type IV secretory system conjugative DNA transfer family protein [gamma proteobacterium endosymbiont of Lamellibrachia anaximandri]
MAAALFPLLLAFALLYAGWWLASLAGWYEVGMAVMGFSLLLFVKRTFTFLISSFQAAQQINLLHESRSISNEYGHARLAREDDNFVKALSNNRSGFYIGTLGKSPLFYDPFASGNGHMLTYAPSRTGKTISVIVPALMHWFGGSMLVTDVKGELTAITARFRRSCGQRVLVFDPFNISDEKGHKFNPLRILVEDVMYNKGRDLHDLARSIAFQLVAEKPNDMGDGVFFRNGGRRLIIALLLYMAVFTPSACTLPMLRKLVWSTSEKKADLAEEMQQSDWFSGLLQDYGNALSDMLLPEYVKTYGAFRDNAMSALEIYDAHSPMGKAMGESDIYLKDMLDGKTTLYLVLPESKLETHGSALGLVATLLLEAIAAAPKPTRVMMILEEMGNIGRLPSLPKALSLLPGKGLRLKMVFQSRRQPIEIYGQHLAGLIEEQSSLLQAWSIRSEADRKAWSVRIGNETKKARSLTRDQNNDQSPWRLSVNERAAPVLSPDEIGRMDSNHQLIAIDGQRVIKAEKIAYFQIEPWRSQAEKSPYHPGDYPKDMPVRHKLGRRS